MPADVTSSSTSTVAGGVSDPSILREDSVGLAADAVDIEERARIEEAGHLRPGAVAAWLFRPEPPVEEVELHHLPQIVTRDENLVWVDLCDFSEETLREVGDLLGIHGIAVDAGVAAWQRPRLDVFGDHFFVSVTVPRLDAEAYRVEAGQLDLFVGRNYVMSSHKRPLPFASRVMARAEGNPELVRLDSAFLLYVILDELLGYYEDLIEHMQGEIEVLEVRALTDTSDDFLADLLRFKRYAFALWQLADHHRTIFSAFLRPDFSFVAGDEAMTYFRELDERLSYTLRTLAGAREEAIDAFQIYVSHVSHRTNQVIRVLTMVSATLLPITVILGFFSTSFHNLPIYSLPGFVLMLLAILLVTGGALAAFRRQGWL